MAFECETQGNAINYCFHVYALFKRNGCKLYSFQNVINLWKHQWSMEPYKSHLPEIKHILQKRNVKGGTGRDQHHHFKWKQTTVSIEFHHDSWYLVAWWLRGCIYYQGRHCLSIICLGSIYHINSYQYHITSKYNSIISYHINEHIPSFWKGGKKDLVGSLCHYLPYYHYHLVGPPQMNREMLKLEQWSESLLD